MSKSRRKKKSSSRPSRVPQGRSAPLSTGRSSAKKDAEASLREKIIGFAYQPRFGRDFERALKLYFGKAARGRTLAADEEEIPGFQEWLIHDFVTRDGQRLIERFAKEIGPGLPENEAELLATWQEMNRFRLFEVQEVHPGKGVVVRDLLGGDTLTIEDHSASRAMRRWMVILARPHQAVDRVCFTGSSTVLTPREKEKMLAAAQKLWDDHRARQPEATLSDFYRERSLDLLRAMQRLQEEARRPPAVLTAEGHKLLTAWALYTVHDANAVADRLGEAEEFEYGGPAHAQRDALHFNWLLRGRSHVPENPHRPENAVMLQTEVATKTGEPVYRSLGDITLWETKMELQCMSRERLQAGKALLSQVLGGLAKHQRDRIEALDLKPATQAPPGSPPAPRTRPQRRTQEQIALERELRERTTREWLDNPVPALGDLSPRQAVGTPEGRAKVVELMKLFEYYEDDHRARGEPSPMDFALIQRELRLSRS